ncbi:MAG: type VI secretion system baseplate subunit TssF [Planctomycetota bacterium]
MDDRLKQAFDEELKHIQEMAGEFVKDMPKIGLRLGRGEKDVQFADPYIERLLEGFAFLAARVQNKLESEFPVFTQNLLQIVYPQYLAPTPSMTVVQFQPAMSKGDLAQGVAVPRGTALKSQRVPGRASSPCTYETCHDVTLWPIEISEVEYCTYLPDWKIDVEKRNIPAQGAIRVRLKLAGGLTSDRVSVDDLTFFLHSKGTLRMRLYEQLLGRSCGAVMQPVKKPSDPDVPWQRFLPKSNISRVGFDEHEAALPYSNRSFHGYRLLHEYFAFPDRFFFFNIEGLSEGFRAGSEKEIDLFFLVDALDDSLENTLDETHLALHCAPAINLFKRRTTFRIDPRKNEHRIRTDLTEAAHYEIYEITKVIGHETGDDTGKEFLPFYALSDDPDTDSRGAYYTLRRTPREKSDRELRSGWRSERYKGGTELFISLVDAANPPHGGVTELTVESVCTNRDLPLEMPVGGGKTDFKLSVGSSVQSIRCLAGPTRPKPSPAHSEVAWRLISHLSLNYLSLIDTEERPGQTLRRNQRGASALRELLGLYGYHAKSSVTSRDVYEEESELKRQIEGVRSVESQTIVRRLPTPGPIAFGPVLEVSIVIDEKFFPGSGAFLLGSVLAEFFSQYVSINSFTETVLRTPERGEIARWSGSAGRRPVL